MNKFWYRVLKDALRALDEYYSDAGLDIEQHVVAGLWSALYNASVDAGSNGSRHAGTITLFELHTMKRVLMALPWSHAARGVAKLFAAAINAEYCEEVRPRQRAIDAEIMGQKGEDY